MEVCCNEIKMRAETITELVLDIRLQGRRQTLYFNEDLDVHLCLHLTSLEKV